MKLHTQNDFYLTVILSILLLYLVLGLVTVHWYTISVFNWPYRSTQFGQPCQGKCSAYWQWSYSQRVLRSTRTVGILASLATDTGRLIQLLAVNLRQLKVFREDALQHNRPRCLCGIFTFLLLAHLHMV